MRRNYFIKTGMNLKVSRNKRGRTLCKILPPGLFPNLNFIFLVIYGNDLVFKEGKS
jgi:hypothetical protein